jgi:hypothetical protein
LSFNDNTQFPACRTLGIQPAHAVLAQSIRLNCYVRFDFGGEARGRGD